MAVREFRNAVAVKPKEAVVRNSLGLALFQSGRGPEAVAEFEKATQLSPDYPDPYSNLATALAGAGRLDEAASFYQKALDLSPDYAEAHNGLGTVLIQMDRTDQAVPHLEKAVRYKPGDARAHATLALALARTWKTKEAIPHAEQAVKLSGGRQADMLDLLGRLYAEVGRFPDAVRLERQALAAASQTNQLRVIEGVEARIKLYEAGRVESAPTAAASLHLPPASIPDRRQEPGTSREYQWATAPLPPRSSPLPVRNAAAGPRPT